MYPLFTPMYKPFFKTGSMQDMFVCFCKFLPKDPIFLYNRANLYNLIVFNAISVAGEQVGGGPPAQELGGQLHGALRREHRGGRGISHHQLDFFYLVV
jgi:hypothetical protein